jgi:DNA polymerase III alpha subunit
MSKQENFAIRFGLGAIKAVGFNMMKEVARERQTNGEFKDIYDFAQRIDPRSVNKKSVEALSKAGAFDCLPHKNRRQLAESFEILSAYSAQKNDEASSDQMSLFGSMPEVNVKPDLKQTTDWTKAERLQKEFEAFGFFLNEHPLDDSTSDLRRRGVIFSDRIEGEELGDGDLVKIAGVVASSKHRSGSRGRFAYLTMSDVFGIFEVMIFDEALITNARDLLVDGSAIVLECLVRKDDGGTRILARDIKKLEEFIRTVPAQEKEFEDIKKQFFKPRSDNYQRKENSSSAKKVNSVANPPVNSARNNSSPTKFEKSSNSSDFKPEKKIVPQINIIIKERQAVFGVRSVLSGLKIADDSAKFSKITFVVMSGGKIQKVELTSKYAVEPMDLTRLRNIPGILDIEG